SDFTSVGSRSSGGVAASGTSAARAAAPDSGFACFPKRVAERTMARLLVIDDDANTLEWMIPALASRGHQVRGLSRATMAMSTIDEWAPDLIIADILMPEMDGLTFARATRRHRGVPVMFVSVAKKQAEAVIAGALGYVQKPATAAEVRAAVDRVLG